MAIEVPAGKILITPADLRKRYGDFDPAIFTRWQEEGKVDKNPRRPVFKRGVRAAGGLGFVFYF